MKGTFPRRVPGTNGQPGRPGKQGPIGLVGKTGATGRRALGGAQGTAGPAAASLSAPRITAANRIELLSVVQMQIDNIQRELATQMHRSQQFAMVITRVEGQLRELLTLSKWLRDA